MSKPTLATETCPEGQTARLVAEIESLRRELAAERENYEAVRCEADTLAMDRQELTKQLADAEARCERMDGACVAAYRALTSGSSFVRDEAIALLRAAIAAAKENKQ